MAEQRAEGRGQKRDTLAGKTICNFVVVAGLRS
jgi:hypothetical protein